MIGVDKVICSCGGTVREADTTLTEEIQYGCGRAGCCVAAYQCNDCGTKFTFALEAPEDVE